MVTLTHSDIHSGQIDTHSDHTDTYSDTHSGHTDTYKSETHMTNEVQSMGEVLEGNL